MREKKVKEEKKLTKGASQSERLYAQLLFDADPSQSFWETAYTCHSN